MLPLVTPCPSCQIALKRVRKACSENEILYRQIQRLLEEEGLRLPEKLEVYHSLDFLVRVVGPDTIARRIRNPLTGFKIAPYYGCQLAGPLANGNNGKDLQDLERLIEIIGAEPLEFPFRTQCCGGSLMFTFDRQAKKLSRIILDSTRRAGADLIATPCGLCQLNLEIAQKTSLIWNAKINSLPVINISQLLGLAFDLDDEEIFLNKKKILAKQYSTSHIS
jgi:heterodisulfide reductase subunit B